VGLWNRSIWAGAAPPDGPVAIGSITLGIWLSLDSDGALTGVRWYQEAGYHGLILGTIWAADQTTLLGTTVTRAKLGNIDDLADGWRTAWLHPRVHLASGVPVLLACFMDIHSAYRDDNLLLGGDVAPEGVRALAVAPDAGAGGRYEYPVTQISNPPTTTTHNLYGIDVFADLT